MTLKHYLIENSEIILSEEIIKGESIKSIIDNCTPLSLDEIFDITQKSLEILAHLAKLKPLVLHGDINSENIIITENNSLAIINFRETPLPFKEKKSLFVAPEQLNGKLSIQSDLYSLGLVIVNLVTRKNLNELQFIDNKIHFRRDTGINSFFKNLLDDLIQPKLKFRTKKAKKSLKHLNKIRKGKFGRDPFEINK